MFESLVITLREGVEAALVLAIASGLLRRRGLAARIPPMLAGALVAALVSIGLAVLATRMRYNEELVEGFAMLGGAAIVLSLVVWMWRAAPRMREEIEQGLDRATAAGAAGLGAFLFGFGMVLREGFETALFLSAAELNSHGLGMLIGALTGLALAIVLGVLFARGVLRVPLKPFFSLTSAVLLLFAFQLFVGGLHELSEGNLLPASRVEMAIVGPLIKNELLLFTLTLLVALVWLLRGGAAPAPERADTSAPQNRLARAERGREAARRGWTAVLGLAVIALLSTAFVVQSRMPARAPAQPLTVTDGTAAFEAAALADKRMHYYEVTLPAGGAVRFFAIRVGDHVQTCFDACEICGDKGYFLGDGVAICRNCTSPIALTSLGRTGGCNPIPLVHAEAGGRVFVRADDLAAALPKLRGR